MTAIIEDGFTFRFDYPSIYEVTVFATDTYGIVGETTQVVDARDIVKFNQTLLFKYSPWQGFNITGSDAVTNSKYSIENRDKDKRPGLGLWYYDELPANKASTWEILHNEEPYKSVGGNFTGSLQSKYFDGRKYNELNYSELFDNNNTGIKSTGTDVWSYGNYNSDITYTPIVIESKIKVSPNEETNAYEIKQNSINGSVFYLQQIKGIFNPREVDRAFSIFLKKGTSDETTLSIHFNISGYIEQTITWDGDVATFGDTPGPIINETTLTSDTDELDDDGFDIETPEARTLPGESIPFSSNVYTTLLRSIEDVGNGWYKVYIRKRCHQLDLSYKPEVYPGGKTQTASGTTIMWGAQVEKVEPYDDLLKAYQPTRAENEVGVYDFIPDVDIRSPLSLGGSKSVLYKYYDEELQPQSHEETTAPLTAQVFFYLRDPFEEALFQPKDIIKYPEDTLYVGFVDWGDGTPMEYADEPFKVTDSALLRHTYEKSGIYEINGEIFNVAVDVNNDILGVGKFKEFILRINIGLDKEIEGEFNQLGGNGFTFLPYTKTFPVISGVSNSSIYKKIIKRRGGFIEGMEDQMDLKYKYLGDKLNTEVALSKTDEDYIGKFMSAFTGSYANQSQFVNAEHDVIIESGGEFCNIYTGSDSGDYSYPIICRLSSSPNFETIYGGGDTYKDNFLDCEDECNEFVRADSVRGFFEGVVTASGELLPDDYNGNTITPKLINYGIGTTFEELGDYLGDSDIGQVRYFNKPIDMWEMLGFECDEFLDSPIEEFKKWEVKYWDSNTGAKTLNTIGSLGNPTYTTEVEWSAIATDGTTDMTVHEPAASTDCNHPSGPGYNYSGTSFNIENLFDELSGDQENYTAHLSTWIYVDSNFDVETCFHSDNRGYLYINGEEISTSEWNDWGPYQYSFTTGWYKIDMIYVESSSGDHVKLGFNIDSIPEITDGGIKHHIEVGDCEFSSPGNPSSPRYWKNIMPEEDTLQYHRRGRVA